ncbi:MAG: hypothetical protein IJU76_04570 [Desulfovibrionaceae bacterium]|nr:hypothetical protein [Desulfovibrionaceae bacterium]
MTKNEQLFFEAIRTVAPISRRILMQGEYYAPSLAEIMESPESMKRAAENFGRFCDAQTRSTKDMNSGIESDEDFSALLDGCGEKDDKFYKKLCEIGADD